MPLRQTKKRTKHKGGSKTRFRILKCSPINSDSKAFSDTCYTAHELLKLARKWNSRHPDNPISLSLPLPTIWENLKQRFISICDNEKCWLKQLNEEQLTEIFSPDSPESWKRTPNEWLSNIDIEKVIKQYEAKYKCFKFIGPVPIDFDLKINGSCVESQMCNFNLQQEINQRKFKFGIIFNTDPHDKSGEHWISLFINLRKKFIYFFDSAGTPIPPQIMAFVTRVQQQALSLAKPLTLTFDQNTKQHQHGGTECGVYSLFFIIHMLEDKTTTNYYRKEKLTDNFIQRFRKVYFN